MEFGASDIQFFNFNTDEVEKILRENESSITKGMNDSELCAYRCGVFNAISFMKQMLEAGETEGVLQFYNAGNLEEFDLNEVVNLVAAKM